MSSTLTKADVDALIRSFGVLLVDDSQYMRKIVRQLLITIGVRAIYEAGDGIAGLEALRTFEPDVVVLDWELPLLDGAEFVRIVRSPGAFPIPDIPIIMLSSYGDRWRVLEARRIGVNEYLRKPVSVRQMSDRLISIVVKPRPIIQRGAYYGPEPRDAFFVGDEPDVIPSRDQSPSG